MKLSPSAYVLIGLAGAAVAGLAAIPLSSCLASSPGESTIARKTMPTTLRGLIDSSRHPESPARFHPPPSVHYQAMRTVGQLLTEGAPACDEAKRRKAEALIESMGMEIFVYQTKSKKNTFWVVRERAPLHRGSGVYAAKCGEAIPLSVQSPHSFHDLNTSGLGYKIFREAKARWLMMNTLNRYKSRPDELRTDEFHPADAAHNPRHLFQAMTEGILDADKEMFFVQLHGFDADWRDSDVIVSDGRVSPQLWSSALAERWKVPGQSIHVFGNESNELGAVTNVQAKAINARGGRFAHLEISLPLRRRMVESSKARRGLVEALKEVTRRR